MNKEIQQLKTELKSAKNKLDKLANNTQKTHLENKLSEIENQIKNLSNPDKSAIKKLEREIKEIKQKIASGDKPNDDKNDKPNDDDGDNPPNPDPQPDNNKGFKYVATKINDNTFKYQIFLDDYKIDFDDFILLFKGKNGKFLKIFQEALKDANSKFPAYFWECPPVSKSNLHKTFEFVVIKSEALANAKQDYRNFLDYLNQPNKNDAHSFPNPSKNSILIIPGINFDSEGKPFDYKNISQFTKNAPEEQQRALWKAVAEKLMEELKKGDAPRWLSTSGTGVSYLHVRIDEKPKYYNYGEYKKWE